MVSDFLGFIKKNRLFDEQEKVLLAVSGGVDSVVMVHLFKTAGLDFVIAHCNFGLRGGESDDDERFVISLAKQLDVKICTQLFDTKKYAIQHNVSTQMAARDLRYEWFNNLCQQEELVHIATAHHKNDVLETMLFNLAKGTGIAGLHGIKAKTRNLVRPLLFATRMEIEAYAKANGLLWREDSSNKQDKYSRNLIRNKVVPLLKEINPSIEDGLATTVERLTGVEDVFKQEVKKLKEEALEIKGDDIYINKVSFKDKMGASVLLAEVIKGFGFSYFQARDILANTGKQVGSIYHSDEFCLNDDREHYIISPNRVGNRGRLEIGAVGAVHEMDGHLIASTLIGLGDVQFSLNKNVAYLDFARLKLPLVVRSWKKGDRFFPLGMKGQKKLSDFMIDEKIPLNLKNRVLLLMSDDKVAWVIGHRIDDRFKVTESTEKVVRFEKISND